MKRFLWLIIFFGINLCIYGIANASGLPISGAGTKYAEKTPSYPQQPNVNVYPNCYWNGNEWVFKQKSKVNFKHKNQNFSQANNYIDYIGSRNIYVQNGNIYNLSPNCYYEGRNWVCTHKSKPIYSYNNGK